jgi:hypothetical protein
MSYKSTRFQVATGSAAACTVSIAQITGLCPKIHTICGGSDTAADVMSIVVTDTTNTATRATFYITGNGQYKFEPPLEMPQDGALEITLGAGTTNTGLLVSYGY